MGRQPELNGTLSSPQIDLDRVKITATSTGKVKVTYTNSTHKLKALATGGMPDHLHILLSLSPEISVSKAVNVLKSNSSKWMKTQSPQFAWQDGYSAFSVSTSALSNVIAYIKGQPEHHKKRDFAQEYLALLKKHGIKYDPVWVVE